ncbi:MAG: DUF1616 domain-containing protein [Desulfurococcaceae archaeon]|jgi:hypothetical protein|nr:DUF1616 domain-containing protein [Desulfurococcaceae archaeon]
MGSGGGVGGAQTLEEYLRSRRRPGYGLTKTLESIYEEVRKGSIELVDPEPPRSFPRYLARAGYSLWFYVVSCLVLSTVAVVSGGDALAPLRWFLGTVFVLFLPGYVTVEALYPEESSLRPLERLALSIGLSLAVVPLIGLLLNYSPWGIRLGPVVTSLATYTEGVAVLASYRKYRLVRLVTELRARRSEEPRGRTRP